MRKNALSSRVLTPSRSCSAEVRLDQPQFGVSPGQAAVLYDGTRVLGGGWIAGTALAAAG